MSISLPTSPPSQLFQPQPGESSPLMSILMPPSNLNSTVPKFSLLYYTYASNLQHATLHVFTTLTVSICRSQWTRHLKRGSAVNRFLRLRVRVPPETLKSLYIQSNEIHNVVALIKCLLVLRCQLYMFRTVTVYPQELLCRYCICRLW